MSELLEKRFSLEWHYYLVHFDMGKRKPHEFSELSVHGRKKSFKFCNIQLNLCFLIPGDDTQAATTAVSDMP